MFSYNFGIALRRLFLAAALSVVVFRPATVNAHGFEGDYFFAPTIQTDDPFATDELTTTIQSFKDYGGPAGPNQREIDVATEFDKEIFPKFALGVTETYTNLKPDANAGLNSVSGFQDLNLSAKYQLWENPTHQWIFSIGGEVDLGGTGSKSLGEESFTTYTPEIYFGKGFGDLPDSLKYAQPLGITGTAGYAIPSEGSDADSLAWGLAVEYSFLYLQQNVEDIGMPAPFKNMIPLVEFSMDTPLNSNGGGSTHTTGTINPGILWEGRYCQVGAEAVIPVSRESGPDVGAVLQVSIWIDDLFPKIFGHPIFCDNDNKNSNEGYPR